MSEEQIDHEVVDTGGVELPKDPEPKLWWLCTTVMGRPHVLEIVSVNGEEVSDDAQPEFGPDDDIVVDRGVLLAPQGYIDFRNAMGPILIPSDFDLSTKANRRPINFKGRSLLIGAYVWINFKDMGEQQLQEQIEHVYAKPDPEAMQQKPVIAGPDGTALNRPGAMDAMGGFRP
jgi:hypothetical protein